LSSLYHPIERLPEVLERALSSGEIASEQATRLALWFTSVLMIIAALTMIVGVFIYVAQAFALMRMAQKLSVYRPWMAWIPIAQNYTFGAVAERCDDRRGISTKAWARIMLIAGIVNAASSVVYSIAQQILPILGLIGALLFLLLALAYMVATTVFLVIRLICVWKMLREFYPPVANVIIFIVSIFAGPTIPMLIACFLKPRPAKWLIYEDFDKVY